MKTNLITATMLTTLLAAAGSSHAAFVVKRSTGASSVGASAPIATIASSPFDDSAARLDDSANYFYTVFNGTGAQVTLAVTTNTVAGCVRLSFDDGDPGSAPVDALRSSVAVSPESIRADGVQTAVATIVPRDASGVLLGRGLMLAVDPSLLWPGRLTGPIEDIGDGSYRARIVSDVPGSGRVEVAVEGVALTATADLTFTALDPNGSLRDLAILRLKDMTSAGNRFAGLVAMAGSGSPQATQLQNAWDDASNALRNLSNGDTSRDDNVVKTDLDRVLRELLPLLDVPGALAPADVRDLMNDLLDTGRLIAMYHLDLAAGECGTCNAGIPRKVCEASDELDAADALRSGADPDWQAILDGYARSVELSLQVEHGWTRC